jgi:hypothetical protein
LLIRRRSSLSSSFDRFLVVERLGAASGTPKHVLRFAFPPSIPSEEAQNNIIFNSAAQFAFPENTKL